jgi:hypothetical protein
MFYNARMTDPKNNDEAGIAEGMFQTYDPENPATTKLCICDIIRDLPELTDEDVAQYHDD